jgi:hypothetical protein
MATPEQELYAAQRARPDRRRARLAAFRAQVISEVAEEIRQHCGECATVLDVLADSARAQAATIAP